MTHDLVRAFSALIQDELAVLRPEWKIIDAGCAPKDEPNQIINAAFYVHLLGNPCRYFRVEVTVNGGLAVARMPWERSLVGKAHVVIRVYHSFDVRSVGWLVGLEQPHCHDFGLRKSIKAEQRVDDVCKRICWYADDPDAQRGLAERLQRAIEIYCVVCVALPDH